MFRTLSLAGKSDFALTAVAWKRVGFVTAKLRLRLRGDHFSEQFLQNNPQLVLRINEVITGIQIAVMLNGDRFAAGFPFPDKSNIGGPGCR